eukprot:5034049-Prymnesium_polylepis.1
MHTHDPPPPHTLPLKTNSSHVTLGALSVRAHTGRTMAAAPSTADRNPPPHPPLHAHAACPPARPHPLSPPAQHGTRACARAKNWARGQGIR